MGESKIRKAVNNWCDQNWGAIVMSAPHSPEGILRCVQQSYPQFAGYQQQDAQEFLRAIIDCIHEDLKRKVPLYPFAYLKKNFPIEQIVCLEEKIAVKKRVPKKKKKKLKNL